MVLIGQELNCRPEWLLALFLTWLVSSVILLLSTKLDDVLGLRVLTALEHLMGHILTILVVEMFLQGIREVFTI